MRMGSHNEQNALGVTLAMRNLTSCAEGQGIQLTAHSSRQETTAVIVAVSSADERPAKSARIEYQSAKAVSPFGLLKVEGIPDWANRYWTVSFCFLTPQLAMP